MAIQISNSSLNLLSRYLELESINPLECWSSTFPDNSKFSFKKLVSHLEKRAEKKAHEDKQAREALLATFRASIDLIIHENRTAWERFGLGGAMGTSIFRGNFVSRLEEFVISHLRLPNESEMVHIKEHLMNSTH